MFWKGWKQPSNQTYMVELMVVTWPLKVFATTKKWYGPTEKNSQSYAPDVDRVWLTSKSWMDRTQRGKETIRQGRQNRRTWQKRYGSEKITLHNFMRRRTGQEMMGQKTEGQEAKKSRARKNRRTQERTEWLKERNRTRSRYETGLPAVLTWPPFNMHESLWGQQGP